MTFQIAFLPWIEQRISLRFGRVEFLTFEEYKSSISQEAADFLAKYFTKYVNYNGNPMPHVLIGRCRGNDLAPLQAVQLMKLRRAVDSMIFCAIMPVIKNSVGINDQSWGPPTSEVFELFHLTFDPQEDHIAVQAGSTTHMWQIDDITFQKPFSAGGSLWKPDQELMQGLAKCSSSKEPIREKVFRSLEWFRLSHSEQNAVSEFSKVVMMATAFEILLDLPPERKTWNFVDKVHNKFNSSQFRRGSRFTQKGKRRSRNLAGLWAGHFYDLRSKIVHGDRISLRHLRYTNRYQDRKVKCISHLTVADLVFYELILLELFSHSFIGQEARDLALDWHQTWAVDPKQSDALQDLEAAVFELFYSFEKVHRRLGWLKLRGD